MNSELINFYYGKISAQLGDKAYRSFTIYIQKIPIPKINQSQKQPFIEKADHMLLLHKNLQDLRDKFLRTINRQFDIDNPRKKLQSWYELDYKQFLKELRKDRKKVYKAENNNSVKGFEKLSLSEQAEWEDYFKAEKEKAQAILSQIENTDQEIDQMVYDLYGLTEEEIRIVEEATV
jgi:hypothetical protein